MLSIKFKLNLINKGKHFKLFFFLIAAYRPFFSVSGSFQVMNNVMITQLDIYYLKFAQLLLLCNILRRSFMKINKADQKTKIIFSS